MAHIVINKEKSISEIRELTNKLYPIHRTLVNEGFDKSLDIIADKIPLNIHKVPSGKEVFDWKVPKAWNVISAKIKDMDGNVLVDFKDNNLHLSAYSEEFNGIIKHKELLNHLNFREELPDAIPYNFHYYKKYWSFNISYNQYLQLFNKEEYEIEIKTAVYDDFLKIAELFIKGKSEKEVLITTYLCHPSMVNDNLSGVVVATELYDYLLKTENLKYSYRLIIVPETIGAISFLAEFPEKYKNVIAGLTIYCCGIGEKVIFKKSYQEDSYINRIVDYAFNYYHTESTQIIPFWPGGSDERQFNAPGIRLPMGALTRTPAGEFVEYHTSLDTPELIQPETLADTLEKLITVFNVLEADGLYENKYKGEPCFSKHNIKYPSFKDALSKSSAYMVKILASETDGTNRLLDIANKWNLNIYHLGELSNSLKNKNLINKK